MESKLVVRLSGRDQYEIADEETLLAELNELDNALVALLAQTETELRILLEKMAARVEARGRVIDTEIEPSDLILPPVDLTLAEAAALFTGEGIIPG
jgi:hypothetical protein